MAFQTDRPPLRILYSDRSAGDSLPWSCRLPSSGKVVSTSFRSERLASTITATGRVATLKTRDVDAAVIDIAAALDLEERGEAKILLNFGDLITSFQNQVIFASDQISNVQIELTYLPDVLDNRIGHERWR